MGWALNGENPIVWVPGDPMPPWITDPDCLVIAHNTSFEKAIYRNIMVKLMSWPNIPNSRFHDTQAVCAMKGIPPKLEKAVYALRLPAQKDMEGSKITNALSKTRRDGSYDRSPESLAMVYAYNRTDLRAEAELNYRIGGLQSCERPVWLLDQRINERGIRIDLDYVSACQSITAGASVPLLNEFASLTNGLKLKSPKLLDWVAAKGVNIPNLRKETIGELLGNTSDDVEWDADDAYTDDDYEATYDDTIPMFTLPADVRRALAIRRQLGSASIKKLERFQACTCEDGRVRGVVAYHAAGPGRWAGRLFQPHNFPRGTLKLDHGLDDKGERKIKAPPVDMVVDALSTGDWQHVAMLFGDPIETVISGLRHAIIAADDRTLNVGDFASIEARIVLALAGQHDKTALLASGADVYIDMACDIFGMEKPKNKEEVERFKAAWPERRQTGKNTILGCGFQMGAKTFHSRYCSDQPMSFAEAAITAYRKKWAPRVENVWKELDEAGVRAVWDRRPTEACGVRFAWEDIWLTARLPSGRKLYYPFPQEARKPMPWDKTDIRPVWTSRAWKAGRWIERDMYGGLLTENVVQALARDLLVSAMFTCERENMPICLTVHDEVVCEPLHKYDDHEKLKQIMQDRPQWAKELQIPVMAETWSGARYKK